MSPDRPNALYCGDNLDVLRQDVKSESVDLVYLDPPFNSQQDYNVIYRDKTGKRSETQKRAFEDTWEWGDKAEAAYQDVVRAGGDVGRTVEALYKILGNSDMMAYLCMMAPRLVELHRVLKPTGSLYLHCDPTASHYLKILLDGIFRPERFRNEVVWYYKTGGMSKRWFGRKHDVLLFYAKTDDYLFNPLKEKSYLMHKYGFTNVEILKDKQGYYTWVGRRDVWDIPALRGNQPEMLGYPTQKPEALLERVLESSSNPGGVVLDPFAGCGTAVAVAHRLKRRWIGIDVTYLALTVIEKRLVARFGRAVRDTWTLGGVPQEPGAIVRLAHESPYGFQDCVLYYLKGRPLTGEERRRGGDEGIDGELVFHEGKKGMNTETRRVIVQVKGAQQPNPAMVRDLRGVLDRERSRGAVIGVLVTASPATDGMKREAASAGRYDSPTWKGGPFPRLQVIDAAEMLEAVKDGRHPVRYPQGADITWPEALRAGEEGGEQSELITREP